VRQASVKVWMAEEVPRHTTYAPTAGPLAAAPCSRPRITHPALRRRATAPFTLSPRSMRIDATSLHIGARPHNTSAPDRRRAHQKSPPAIYPRPPKTPPPAVRHKASRSHPRFCPRYRTPHPLHRNLPLPLPPGGPPGPVRVQYRQRPPLALAFPPTCPVATSSAVYRVPRHMHAGRYR